MIFQPWPVRATPGTPLRQPETIGRIWFAPFVDEAGHWYDQSFIYVVEQRGRWLNEFAPYPTEAR